MGPTRIAGLCVIAAGVVVMIVNFNADHDCIWEVVCHDDGGLSANFGDRMSWAVGLSTENVDGHGLSTGQKLFGFLGPVLVMVGGCLLLASVLYRKIATTESTESRDVGTER